MTTLGIGKNKMRVIVLGSELISLSTAYHLSAIGYEVTVIEARTQSDVKQNSLVEPTEVQLFKQQLEDKMCRSGVHVRYACTVQKCITQGNRIRGVAIRNEHQESEILVADKFIVALDAQFNSVLSSLGIYSSANFKRFNYGYAHPLMGRSCYSNLYLNVGYNSGVSLKSASQAAKLLADLIYNPSVAAYVHYQPSIENKGSRVGSHLGYLLNTIHRFFFV